MSLWIILGLFGAVIIFLIIIASYFQIQEHKAQTRRDFVNKMLTQVRFYQKLIESIPFIYLPKEIYSLMLQEIIQVLQRAKEVQFNDIRVNKMLLSYQQDNDQLQKQSYPGQQVSQTVKNLAEAHTIQHRLFKISKFIVKLYSLNRIKAEQSKQYNELLKEASTRVDADCQFGLAVTAHQYHDFDLAMYHYLRSIEILNKQNESGHYQSKIQDIELILSGDDFVRYQKEKEEHQPAEKDHNKKWDEFFEDEQRKRF